MSKREFQETKEKQNYNFSTLETSKIPAKDIIYNSLINNGVKHAFIFSGGSIMPVIDKLYKSNINYTVNSHEQNCGHAATGYAKTSKETGVVMVTSGPGITNMITPMLDATNDSTPLVVISGQVSLEAVGTNAFVLTKNRLEDVMPYLTYLRVNFSAGEKKRYSEIMGVKESYFERVVQNIRDMVDVKKRNNLSVTIGLQMVLMPEYSDQIIPLASLGKKLQPDYLIFKHCSDNEDGDLGVNYAINSKLSIFSNINHGFQAPDIDRFFVSVWQSSSPWAWLRRDFKSFMKAAKVDTFNIGLNTTTDRNKVKLNDDIKDSFFK